MNKIVNLAERRALAIQQSAQRKVTPGRDLHASGRTRPIVRIHLFGPMRAITYLGDNILPHGTRARAVLGYLCLAGGEYVSRAALAGLLWDQVSDAAARTNLRQALRELSMAFGKFGNELLVAGRDILRLNIDACWIDALAVQELDPSSLATPHGDLKTLCRGEFLAGLDGTSASFDRWLIVERTRLAERLQLLLERELQEKGGKGKHARNLKRALADTREQLQSWRNIARRRETRQTNYPAPVDAECVQAPDDGLPPKLQSTAHLPAPRGDRLRVGVLPFLSGVSQNEDNLAFSLSQEIAAALARFRWFDVIAPMALRPTPSMGVIDEHHLRHMGFDYVVDGTISGNGKYTTISVRLIDVAEYARPVWSESFEVTRGELHRVNELVTTRIVAQIDPVILFIEGQPRRREHYGATGLLLLAIPLIFSMERKKYEEAGRLIAQALQMDPENSMVSAWAAHWHLFYIGQGWAKDTDQTMAAVRQHAVRAIRLDHDNAEALGIFAHCCSFGDKDFDTAVHYFDRALRLNPSLAFIWGLSAPTYCYIGEPDSALQRMERYRDLAPLDPYYFWFQHVYAIAYTFKGDYERAVIQGRRAVKTNPDYIAAYRPLIASLGHLGRREEAKPYIEKLLLLDPTFTVEQFAATYPIKKDSDRRRYMKGLLLAGVPAR